MPLKASFKLPLLVPSSQPILLWRVRWATNPLNSSKRKSLMWGPSSMRIRTAVPRCWSSSASRVPCTGRKVFREGLPTNLARRFPLHGDPRFVARTSHFAFYLVVHSDEFTIQFFNQRGGAYYCLCLTKGL